MTFNRVIKRKTGQPRWLLPVSAALLAALAAAAPAYAQHPGPPPIGKGAFGRITSVSASAITVKSRRGTAATFTLSASVPVRLNGKSVALSALSAGQFAVVTSDDGTAATTVDAHTKPGPPHGGDSGPGGDHGPGGPPPDGPPMDGPPPPSQ